MLQALGAQTAVAIENARLFQQSDHIAEVIHELRTPLASIHTAAHLLNRPERKEELRSKIVTSIQNETARLFEMTTTFLDLVRMESSRSKFFTEYINLTNLLRNCADIMKARIEEKGLSLQLHLEERIPLFHGDKDKVKQVILNLLNNAVKYNRPHGKITLKSGGGKGDKFNFSVIDTGAGISETHIKSLFQKFYRIPGAERVAKGTGLGLSITKEIVTAHAGNIEVTSEIGLGTNFTVWLPLQKERDNSA